MDNIIRIDQIVTKANKYGFQLSEEESITIHNIIKQALIPYEDQFNFIDEYFRDSLKSVIAMTLEGKLEPNTETQSKK